MPEPTTRLVVPITAVAAVVAVIAVGYFVFKGSGSTSRGAAPSITTPTTVGASGQGNAPADLSELPDEPEVSAYVAVEAIPRGTSGTDAVNEHSIRAATAPRSMVPATAVFSPDAVIAKNAVFDIPPGTVIVEGMFVDPARRARPTTTSAASGAPCPPAAGPADRAGRSVVVHVTGAIPAGTSGESAIAAGQVEVATAAPQFVPGAAVHQLVDLCGKFAVFDLAPNTVLVDGLFAPPG